MKPTIERMHLQDLPAVLAIEEASFIQPWSAQSFRSELANNQLATYLVAREDGAVVGYGGVWVILDDAHVTTLAVDQRCRRRGIATELLKALIEKSRSLGARRMSLEVRPSNTTARRLYENFGFTVKGVRKRYYLNEDGLVMFKDDLGEGEENEAGSGS
jgi:[ribosomal protein S18]-alanine N-acetyltransferase